MLNEEEIYGNVHVSRLCRPLKWPHMTIAFVSMHTQTKTNRLAVWTYQ